MERDRRVRLQHLGQDKLAPRMPRSMPGSAPWSSSRRNDSPDIVSVELLKKASEEQGWTHDLSFKRRHGACLLLRPSQKIGSFRVDVMQEEHSV